MTQLILHLLGDYIFQNTWMASNKRKMSILGFLSCLVHCIVYTIPFAFVYQNVWVISGIFVTHFFMDKFGLAEYWIRFYNNNWGGNSFGYEDTKPVWLTTWLYIITDNIFHIIFNFLSIEFLVHL